MEHTAKINVARMIVLVLGAGMTILSAILIGYYGERQMHALQDVRDRIASQERLIAEHWQNIQALRNREDGVVLLAALARISPAPSAEMGTLLARYMEHTLDATNAPASIEASVTAAMKNGKAATATPYEATLSAIESHRRIVLNTIDTLYAEMQAMHREERALQERDSRLRILALFCQIMGLILVLAARSSV